MLIDGGFAWLEMPHNKKQNAFLQDLKKECYLL